MNRLHGSPACADALAEDLGMKQPLLLHHLKVLTEAGLVSVERQGRRRMYTLEVERWSYCRRGWPT